MRYFYHPNLEESTLSEESSKHIVQVLRMQEGDQFLLTDGKGSTAIASITNAHKKACEVSLSDIKEKPYAKHEISIAISFTKNNSRMEWFLEKATEIGVREIIPLLSHRSERNKIKFERFHKILISAMLQSKQCHIPVLREQFSLQSVCEMDFDSKFIAHCEAGMERNALKDAILQAPQRTDMRSSILLIGPEGDFTDLEIQDALQHNFNPVSLGENRLRTETAGVVGLTLLKQLNG